MNKIILTLTLLITFTFNTSAQNDSIPQTAEQQVMAKKIAIQWFNYVMVGKSVDSLMAISKLPFALDRKEIINSKEALKAIYKKVLEKTANMKFPEIKAEVHASKYEIIDNCIPINAIIIQIKVLDGDSIFVSVAIAENEYKVIGFSD